MTTASRGTAQDLRLYRPVSSILQLLILLAGAALFACLSLPEVVVGLRLLARGEQRTGVVVDGTPTYARLAIPEVGGQTMVVKEPFDLFDLWRPPRHKPAS